MGSVMGSELNAMLWPGCAAKCLRSVGRLAGRGSARPQSMLCRHSAGASSHVQPGLAASIAMVAGWSRRACRWCSALPSCSCWTAARGSFHNRTCKQPDAFPLSIGSLQCGQDSMLRLCMEHPTPMVNSNPLLVRLGSRYVAVMFMCRQYVSYNKISL
jgi:hypothetical protein